jgi:hypothetical protein
VPVAAGKVAVLDPAIAGATNETLPDVLPVNTKVFEVNVLLVITPEAVTLLAVTTPEAVTLPVLNTLPVFATNKEPVELKMPAVFTVAIVEPVGLNMKSPVLDCGCRKSAWRVPAMIILLIFQQLNHIVFSIEHLLV